MPRAESEIVVCFRLQQVQPDIKSRSVLKPNTPAGTAKRVAMTERSLLDVLGWRVIRLSPKIGLHTRRAGKGDGPAETPYMYVQRL